MVTPLKWPVASEGSGLIETGSLRLWRRSRMRLRRVRSDPVQEGDARWNSGSSWPNGVVQR